MFPIGQIKTNPNYTPTGGHGGRSQTAGGKHETEIVFGHVIVALLIWHFTGGKWALVYFTWPGWLVAILYPFMKRRRNRWSNWQDRSLRFGIAAFRSANIPFINVAIGAKELSVKIKLIPLALMAVSGAYASTLAGGSRMSASFAKPTLQAAEQEQQSAHKQEEIQNQSEKAAAENALILKANQELAAHNWQQALPLLQQLIGLDPSNWQLYSRLGDAQYGLGRYQDAAQAYDRGVGEAQDAIDADRKKSVDDSAKIKVGIATMLINEGNAFSKLHKENDAIAAYSRAAAIAPNPAMAYFDLCAVQYNTGAVAGALDACDKTIAVDPNKAEAYFIRGALLLGKSEQNSAGKISVPAGTSEAFAKYVELDPNGRSAKYAEEALAFISIGINPLTHEGWNAKAERLPEIPPSAANERLVHKVEPTYPELALISHVQGDVEFKAIINAEGTIKDLQLVSGHALLVKSAADAITQWQYKPYLVNGEPTEVVTTIIVKFHS